MRRPRAVPLLAALALAACADSGTTVPRGGSYFASLDSPNGAEGAALVTLSGSGFTAAEGAGGTRVIARSTGTLTRLLLVRETPGALGFDVTLEPGARLPEATVVQVAGGDNQPRAVSGYRLAYTRRGGSR